MYSNFKYLFILLKLLWMLETVASDTYNVKITTEQHVNLIDSRFLSFTVDPKYIFDSSGSYDRKHCICMASSLTPAYLRLSGPSTSRMTVENTTLYLDAPFDNKTPEFSISSYKNRLSMTSKQLEKFVHWAKKTGFDLVFALNNEEKMGSGIWDPKDAMKTLNLAEKADVADVVWQLGYECANQTIEEYLNDLETLRVIVETFPGKSSSWKVVGGDVAPCLNSESKSDFKDYVTLSDDMMDAIFLNGNSSAQQLEKMSETDRLRLLKLLSSSDTPLWLTEKTQSHYNELERAADWLASLGYSARNGFSVHFRELSEKELHEPTLSFYMALLFKNLVGERVLDVEMAASQATLFAHCTSLRHKPIPGAVTLYGANMDDEPARFSIKLSKKEEGGDIMQFVFGHDGSGNIVVNGRPMYLEGDIRPVVKRVRPYKTLLLNLPPKSFGFWVLANTQIDACHYKDEKENPLEIIHAEVENNDDDINAIKSKRSAIRKREIEFAQALEHFNLWENVDFPSENYSLRKQIENLNDEIKNFQELLTKRKDEVKNGLPFRFKRQTFNMDDIKSKQNALKVKFSKIFHDKQINLKSNLKEKLSQIKNEKLSKYGKGRQNKKYFKRSQNKPCSDEYNDAKVKVNRERRSIAREKTVNHFETEKIPKHYKSKTYMDKSSENEVDSDFTGNILHKLKGTFKHLPLEIEEADADDKQNSDANEITFKTKLLDDGAVINISEKNDDGILKSTFQDLLSLLSDLNKHLNRFWNTFAIFD